MNALRFTFLVGLMALLLGHSDRAQAQTNAAADAFALNQRLGRGVNILVTRAVEARGWSCAYWQFDSDFILYDVKREAWVEPIRDALIPKVTAAR